MTPHLSKLHFIEFAAQGGQCSQAHAEYVEREKGQRILWLSALRAAIDSEASRAAPLLAIPTLLAPHGMGAQFSLALDSLVGESLFISFDLDAVGGADAPGVSCPASFGLTAAEACDMCLVAGANPRVRLMDLSEFNPKGMIIEREHHGS